MLAAACCASWGTPGIAGTCIWQNAAAEERKVRRRVKRRARRRDRDMLAPVRDEDTEYKELTIVLQKRQNICVLCPELDRSGSGCVARQHAQSLEHLAREAGKWQGMQVFHRDPFPRYVLRQQMLFFR